MVGRRGVDIGRLDRVGVGGAWRGLIRSGGGGRGREWSIVSYVEDTAAKETPLLFGASYEEPSSR